MNGMDAVDAPKTLLCLRESRHRVPANGKEVRCVSKHTQAQQPHCGQGDHRSTKGAGVVCTWDIQDNHSQAGAECEPVLRP